jgi:hypothetical protein
MSSSAISKSQVQVVSCLRLHFGLVLSLFRNSCTIGSVVGTSDSSYAPSLLIKVSSCLTLRPDHSCICIVSCIHAHSYLCPLPIFGAIFQFIHPFRRHYCAIALAKGLASLTSRIWSKDAMIRLTMQSEFLQTALFTQALRRDRHVRIYYTRHRERITEYDK